MGVAAALRGRVVLYVARFLARGEHWAAHVILANVRGFLLRLLETRAREQDRDPRHLSLGIQDWAGTETVARLDATFADAQVRSIRTALVASVGLGRDAGRELASMTDLRYPDASDAVLTEELERLLSVAAAHAG